MLVETVLQLEREKRVKPFAGETGFLPVDLPRLLELHDEPFRREEDILKSAVEFKGIKGLVVAKVNSGPVRGDIETPLGEAKTDITYDDNGVKVNSLPVSLGLVFYINSMKQWSDLLSDRAVFDLGIRHFPVRYHLETNSMTVRELQEALDRFGELPAIGSLVFPETYHPATVVLPYDVACLSEGVNLTMGFDREKLFPPRVSG